MGCIKLYIPLRSKTDFSLLTNYDTIMEPWLRIYTQKMLEHIISTQASTIQKYTTIRKQLEDGTYTPEFYVDEDGFLCVKRHTFEFCDRELFIAQRQHDDASNELKRRSSL